jgi:peptidoglycan hydrolase CwlO-like protein
LKISRKAILEAELKSLLAEIEADDKKIAELPGLIEKIQEEATSAIAEMNQCNAELTILLASSGPRHHNNTPSNDL